MEDIQIVDFSTLKKKKNLSDFQAIDFSIKKPANQDKDIAQGLPQEISQDPKPQQISKVSDAYIHSYDALLARAFDILRAQNPELGEKKKLVMKAPQLVKMTARRIAWTNFVETCEKLNRLPEHLGSFILTELGVEGSLDEGKLIWKHRQTTCKEVQSLLVKYFAEYVACNVCKGSDTVLERDNATRLTFLKCKGCKVDSRSVATIKSGPHVITRADRQRPAP